MNSLKNLSKNVLRIIYVAIFITCLPVPLVQAQPGKSTDTEISAEAKGLYNQGANAFDNGEYENAITYYTQALAKFPKYPAALSDRAISYLRLQKFDKAITDYTTLFSFDKGLASEYYNRGLCYESLEKFEPALEDFSQAIKLKPEEGRYYAGKFFVYCKQGKEILANQSRTLAMYHGFSGLTDCNYQSDATYTSMLAEANKKYQEENYDQALSAFSALIKKFPNSAAGYNGRGLCYATLKQLIPAHKDYEKATELDPLFTTAYENDGLLYFRNSEDEKSIAKFSNALKLCPTNNANFYLGRLMNFKKDYSKAIEYFNAALQISSRDIESMFYKAFALGKSKQYTEAISLLDIYMSYNKKNYDAWFNRGLYKYKLARDEAAIADFTEAIALNDKISDAFKMRALSLCMLDKKTEAVADERKAVALGATITTPCK